MDSAPIDVAEMLAALKAQRNYTLDLYADLPDALWTPLAVPYATNINPPLWELGHIAWFQEYFSLRHSSVSEGSRISASCRTFSDELFNSNTVAHRDRWTNNYPSRDVTMDYMQCVLERLCEVIELEGAGALHNRHVQLVLAHEDMHQEALAMTLAALALPIPDFVPQPRENFADAHDISFSGGSIMLGQNDARGFQFDNETPPLLTAVKPFSIASQPVTAAQFAAFRASAEYQNANCWSAAGNVWRTAASAQTKLQSKLEPKPSSNVFAAMHVNFFEAEAYCLAANRRLPTEVEWEFAATHSSEFWASVGDVWEWTASPLTPYPGFTRGVYAEYSEPWFHSHQVLKGASFATHARMKYPQYRNFYTPDRADMFCGFRTCAIV